MSLLGELERLVGVHKKRHHKHKAKGKKRTPRKKNGEFRKRKRR